MRAGNHGSPLAQLLRNLDDNADVVDLRRGLVVRLRLGDVQHRFVHVICERNDMFEIKEAPRTYSGTHDFVTNTVQVIKIDFLGLWI